MNLLKKTLDTASSIPDQPIVSDAGGVWTYQELFNRGNAVARRLQQEISPEETPQFIGLLMEQGRLFTCSFIGVMMAGHVPVPLNNFFGKDVLTYVCSDASIQCVLTEKDCLDKAELPGMTVMDVSGLVEREGDLLPISDIDEQAAPAYETGGDDLCTILYTSGTTANPKGVMLSHENIMSNVKGCRRAMEITSNDRLLFSLPLFHSFGLTCGCLLPLLTGVPTHSTGGFSPRRILNTLRDQESTVYLGIPSQYHAIARGFERSSISTPIHSRHDRIRLFSGGEPLPPVVQEAVQKSFERPVLEGYGLTETSPVISVNRPEKYRPGTVGPPLDNVEVRIVDPDSPANSRSGDKGEIQVRGPSVMKGYLNLQEETETAFTEDGWFRTGDIGTFVDDEYLRVTGRLKNLIICAGENISPVEIEEVLSEIDGVERAAVVGAPDERRGEVPVAFLQVSGDCSIDEQEVKDLVRERLGRLRMPATVTFLDELPTGPTGKVLKKQLLQDA